MVDLDKALLPLISAGGDASPSGRRQHSLERLSIFAHQTASASLAAGVCVQLGEALNLQRSDAYRLGAAAGVAFSTGQATLTMLLGAVKFHPLIDDSPLSQTLHSCAAAQLSAVDALLHMTTQPQAAAALAASVARPQVLLPWLSTVTGAAG